MARLTQHAQWVKRGRQRRAVVQVLRKPMTGSEICAAARTLAPRLQVRDVWWLCRELEARGLVFCLNEAETTGKLYFLTDLGRAVARRAFGQAVAPLPGDVDWQRYGWVMRGKIRRRVLQEIERSGWFGQEGKSASEIRRQLLDTCPTGLSVTLRALRELTDHRLATRVTPRPARRRKVGNRKLFVLTAEGRRVVEELRR